MSIGNFDKPGDEMTQEQAFSGSQADNNDETANEDVNNNSNASSGFNDFDFVDDDEQDQTNGLGMFNDDWAEEYKDPRTEENQNPGQSGTEENNDEETEEEVKDFSTEDILNYGDDNDITNDNIANGLNKTNTNTDSKLSIQSAIEFLKEKGIEIPEQESSDLVRETSINQISDEIFNLKKIVGLPQDKFLEIAVRNQVTTDYNKSNKIHLVGSPEFEEEIRDKIDEMGINFSLRENFLINHQRSLSDYIQQKESTLKDLKLEDLKVKEQKVIEMNASRLESIRKISIENGLNLNDAQQAYAFLQSEEYKEIVKDPDFIAQSVLAELARRKGVKLFNKDNSYARGVNDTLEEIKNNSTGKSSNSNLGNQMSGTQNLQTSQAESNPWLALNKGGVQIDNGKNKNKRAAGGF